MCRYLLIGVLMVAGIILVCSEANGGMLATMGVKFAGLLCLASVALMTKGEEA